jgi:predicted short-subunit dehydrogenase-like oxidoreductase (DUF2520 family)
MSFTKKDKLIIIGAGKISSSLTPALIEAGYPVHSIISSTRKEAKELADKNKIKSYSNTLESLDIERGVYILAVPDDNISILAEHISKLKINFAKSLFIHLSGSQDISLLRSIEKKQGNTASFHIMQTFPSKKRLDIKNSFSAIETLSIEANDYLFKLAKGLKLKPFRLDSENKVIYHLAGVYASNFLNAILFQSQKLFELLDLKEYSFYDVFSPILFSTIKNITETSPAIALSGPVERGDIDTINKHIKEIRRISKKKPELLFSYLSLSLLLVEASMVKHGKLTGDRPALKELLRKELGKRQ